ncbi:MAG: aldehyde dehydrogenase [Acidimicrobiales bacterium]|nr:aldehyde dehydrogenase [Acidimicrobiales bacterium]MCB1262351.1 aldehyde dehydrogenase [Acidimicrobiales bacterium]
MTNEVWREERLLIDGRLVDASGGTYDNINPATESVLGVAGDGTVDDMDAAIGAARRAFDETSWSTDVELRLACLRQLHEGLERHREELRATTVAEVGCPVGLTHMAQLDTPIDGVAWLIDLLEHYDFVEDLGDAEPFGMPSHRWVQREAAGVVGAITPWNFPVQINLAKVAPALAAGCTVVLKPAPDTPWTGSLLGRIVAEETDIPAGVLNVVTSSGHEGGALLASDPRVDLVSLTGSTATGKKVMAAAAESLKRVFLELGGKSAAVVLDDADIAGAAGATGFQVMTHAGQGCAITTRLVVPRARMDEAVEAVVGVMSSLPYGDPTKAEHIMGPLISARQRERVLGYIETGIAEGATAVLGGGVPEHLPVGYYVEPTVLVDVDPNATVAQEEIFGPVLVVLPHDGDDDAVAVANNSAYGLSGAVFAGTIEHAKAVASRIRTGTLSLNNGLWYGPDVPFGGYKQSGLGREMGRAGFEEYLETKSLAEPA